MPNVHRAQGWIQEIYIRGIECVLVYVRARNVASRGVWGHTPLKKLRSEIDSGALLGKKKKNFARLRQRAISLPAASLCS